MLALRHPAPTADAQRAAHAAYLEATRAPYALRRAGICTTPGCGLRRAPLATYGCARHEPVRTGAQHAEDVRERNEQARCDERRGK